MKRWTANIGADKAEKVLKKADEPDYDIRLIRSIHLLEEANNYLLQSLFTAAESRYHHSQQQLSWLGYQVHHRDQQK